MPANIHMLRAISRVAENGSSNSLSCRAVNDASDMIRTLNVRGSSKATRAATIIREARAVGFSDSAAIHIAIIAAAESGFVPGATNPTTGAAGYFQLHPKYWSSSGPTNTSAIIRSQLKQILGRYGNTIVNDLAVFYGTHFYPGLGAAYSENRTLGLQPGRSTYGQYAFQDALGSVFHSPLIISVYAAEKFASLTGVDIDLEIPKIPSVVSKTSQSGKKLIHQASLQAPIVPSAAADFSISVTASSVTASFIDPAGSADFSAISVSYDDVEWIASRDVVQVEISETSESIHSDSVHPLLGGRVTDFDVVKSGNNILYPAIDTLIARLRTREVDLEILKSNLAAIAFSPDCIGPMFVRRVLGGRAEETEASVIFRATYLTDDGFLKFLDGFSDQELVEVLSSLLAQQISRSSANGLATQLTFHRIIGMTLRIGGVREEESFPDTWDLPWFDYAGVLFPASILITPNLGTRYSSAKFAVGHRYASSLIDWTREMAGAFSTDLLATSIRLAMPKNAIGNPSKQR